MYPKLRLCLAGAFVFAAALVASAAPDAAAKRVKLNFVNPDKFTDVKLQSMSDDKAAEEVRDQLDRHLQRIAKNYLPEGATLELDVTDVDLAGAYEPWRGPRFDDIRMVRDIYPPRLEFAYKLKGADGAVLSEGKEKLTDLAFNFTVKLPDDESTRYEKELLTNWMRVTFRAKK